MAGALVRVNFKREGGRPKQSDFYPGVVSVANDDGTFHANIGPRYV